MSAGALVVTALYSRHMVGGLPCLFRGAFGVPCPACGLTRSISALWRADLVLSARYHPIGVAVFVILVVIVVGSALYLVAPATRPGLSRVVSIAGRPVVARVALAVLILTWLVRLGDLALHRGVFLW